MILLFYFIYLISASLWSYLLFYKSLPATMSDCFYAFIAALEFLSILFIRTRSTFKFFPRFANFNIFLFLFYVKFNCYGFAFLALYLTISFIVTFFILNILDFEIPALSWNPYMHYAPSMDKPRTLYFPLFSMANYYDLPHFWSMFYPLHDRSYFNNSQMALVDRNFMLLNSTLENARNNNMNNNIERADEYDLEMQNFLEGDSLSKNIIFNIF